MAHVVKCISTLEQGGSDEAAISIYADVVLGRPLHFICSFILSFNRDPI